VFVKALAMALLVGLGTACSGAVAEGGGDAGTSDAHPATHDAGTDHASFDAGTDHHVDASLDAPAHDAGGGAAMPTVGCFKVSDTGSNECAFSTANGGGCASVPQSLAGSCPSAGLFGCCVDGGGSSFTATCYYGDAGFAESMCENAAYEGFPAAWDPNLP
jgi:hypothetical protein